MGRYSENKEPVLKLLEINEEVYQNNVLEFSYAFLEHKNYAKPIIEELHQMSGYWTWWRNQFAIADLHFLNVHSVFNWDIYPLEMQRDLYGSCHIGIQAYPSRLIEKIDKGIQLKRTLKQYEKR